MGNTRKTLEQINTQWQQRPVCRNIHDDHTALRHVHGFFLVGQAVKEELQNKGVMEGAQLKYAAAKKTDRMQRASLSKTQTPDENSNARGAGTGRRMQNTTNRMPNCRYGGCTVSSILISCPSCKQWLTHSRRLLHMEELHRNAALTLRFVTLQERVQWDWNIPQNFPDVTYKHELNK